MSNTENKPSSNNPFSSGSKKNSPKGGGGFNYYWLYAIFAIGLIGLNLFNWSPQPDNINYGKFKEMVQRGDVKRVEIINKEIGKVYLKDEALGKEEYKDQSFSKKGSENSFIPRGPQFTFNIPQADFFGENLNKW